MAPLVLSIDGSGIPFKPPAMERNINLQQHLYQQCAGSGHLPAVIDVDDQLQCVPCALIRNNMLPTARQKQILYWLLT